MQNQKRKHVLEDEGTVYEAAQDRFDHIWEHFDEVWLAFSGGKDSGAVLNMAMDAWDRNGPFLDENDEPYPIQVVHHDDEFAYPETEAYIKRILDKWGGDRINFHWCVMPMKYGNGCTFGEKYWYTWVEEDRDSWLRDHPATTEQAERDCVNLITPEDPSQSDFEKGNKHTDIAHDIFRYYGKENAINLTGLRTAESMNRHHTILSHGGWLKDESNLSHVAVGHPIYDWDDRDLWAIHKEHEWDYNKAYDKLYEAGYAPNDMRTAHPYNYMAITAGGPWRQKHAWAEEFEEWAQRLEGAEMSFELGPGYYGPSKPDDTTWREYCSMLVNAIEDDDQRERVAETIQSRLERHFRNTGKPLKQHDPCPHCDQSWESQAKYAYEEKFNTLLGQSQ